MSKKEERIVVGVNNQAIRTAKADATNYLVLLNRADESLKKVTEGNVKVLSVEKIDEYLNGKTGFLNGLMSAMAYNLQDEYKNLLNLIAEVDKGIINLKYISKGKVDDAKIQEAHTRYLRDVYVDEYLRIKDAVEVLNRSQMFTIKGSVSLGREKVVFDATKFQATKLMSKR